MPVCCFSGCVPCQDLVDSCWKIALIVMPCLVVIFTHREHLAFMMEPFYECFCPRAQLADMTLQMQCFSDNRGACADNVCSLIWSDSVTGVHSHEVFFHPVINLFVLQESNKSGILGISSFVNCFYVK